MTAAGLEQVWRRCAPEVLAALVRGYGDFDAAEDAVQEALLAAVRQWPGDGLPDNPRGWLITVASRRLVDQWRSERARTGREQLVARRTPAGELLAPGADEMDGRVEGARAAFSDAARLATSIPEQRYLNTRAAPREPVRRTDVPIMEPHPR